MCVIILIEGWWLVEQGLSRSCVSPWQECASETGGSAGALECEQGWTPPSQTTDRRQPSTINQAPSTIMNHLSPLLRNPSYCYQSFGVPGDHVDPEAVNIVSTAC